jgi:hypothetical protein
MLSDVVLQLLLIRILEVSMRAGYHYRPVIVSCFVQLLTPGLPFCFRVFSCSSALGSVSLFFLAAGDTAPPGSFISMSITFLCYVFEKERILNASVINHVKSLEYTHVKIETQLNLKIILCYDLNANTTCALEQYAIDKDRVSLQRRGTRRISYLPDLKVGLSTALLKKRTETSPYIATK